MTGLLLTLTIFPLTGLAVSRVVGRTSIFLLGLGAAGMTLYVTLLLRIPIIWTLGALPVLSIAMLIVYRRPSADWRTVLRELSPATLVMAIPCLVVLLSSAITPLHDFDGRAFWLLKAKAIATERHIDGPFFKGETVYNPRSKYPLLVPLDAGAVMIASGETDDRHVRWIYSFALFALAWHSRKWVGVWPAALIPWIPQFTIAVDGGATSGYNDVILAAFAGCAFFELVEGESPVRFGLWLAFLVLTKSEGLPYALILLIAGSLVFRKRVALALPALATAVGTLVWWRSLVPAGDEEDFLARLGYLPGRLDQIPHAVMRMTQHAMQMNLWGAFWLAAFFAGLVLLILRRRAVLLPLYIIVSMLIVYVSAFVVSSWVLDHLIEQSADRLLMHLAVPALYLIALGGDAMRTRVSILSRRNTSPGTDTGSLAL